MRASDGIDYYFMEPPEPVEYNTCDCENCAKWVPCPCNCGYGWCKVDCEMYMPDTEVECDAFELKRN